MNDKIVIRSQQDFSSEQCKKLYKQLTELKNDYSNQEKTLDQERIKFHQSPAHQQKAMRAGLIEMEKLVVSMEKDIHELEKKIRNIQP